MKGFENPEECLNRAAEAMKSGFDKGITSGHLCLYKDVLAYRKKDHTQEHHTIFATVTAVMFTEGFSPTQWQNLKIAMWKIYKEKI